MNQRLLFTIKWTQPYATTWQRPYLRGLQQQLEQIIEQRLVDNPTYSDAKQVLERFMKL